MTAFRRLLLHHPALAAWMVACALLVKLLVPVGFMPDAGRGGIAVVLCPEQAPAMPGMAGHHGRHEPAKAEPSCGFAGLSTPFLGGGEVLAAVDAAAAPVASVLPRFVAIAAMLPAHLRPPSRGPPRG